MLNLARECPRLVQFAHVSTLYVAGRRQGLVTEEALRHEDGYVNTYEQAKHEAENIVLSQCGGLPVGVYRLSSVIDEVGKGGCLRQVIRFLPSWARSPYFPADRRVPVDLISSDWAARALSVLIARHFSPGCIRHVCAGESASLPVGVITDRVFNAYEKLVNSSVRWPKLIALSDFESLYARLPRNQGIGRALAGLMTFIPHLSISQPFDSTITRELLAGSGVPQPDSNSLLSRVLAKEFRYAEAG
jgi:long-chain acyl-CoA synthetase